MSPPAVTKAIAGGSVSHARTLRVVVRREGLEAGKLLRRRIEAYGTIGRGGPDHTVAIDVHRHSTTDRGHGRRRFINSDLLGCCIEEAQAPASRIDVEPEVPFRIADQAVAGGRLTVLRLDLQIGDLSRLAVNFSDRDKTIGVVDGVIEIAVESHAAVMRKLTEL